MLDMKAELTQFAIVAVDTFDILFFHEFPFGHGEESFANNPLSIVLSVQSVFVLEAGQDVGRYVGGVPKVYDFKKKQPRHGLGLFSNMTTRVPHISGVVAPGTVCEPISQVSCVGDICGEAVTGFYQDCCVVRRSMENYALAQRAALRMTDPGTQAPIEDDTAIELKLPRFDDPVLLRLATRWLQEKPPTAPGHRRFILYYWFAITVFGATERIRLPACVVAAVRAAYPNPPGVPYVGHIDA